MTFFAAADTAGPPVLYFFDENLEATNFAAPTTRFQNMRRKPPMAATIEASGMRASGPIYTRELSRCCGGAGPPVVNAYD